MKNTDLIHFMDIIVRQYEQDAQYSAMRVCRATRKHVTAFAGKETIPFAALTKSWIKSFENFLFLKLEDNSVSTYIRMLQSVVNKAVYKELTYVAPGLFKNVFKGRRVGRSRAMEKGTLQTIVNSNPNVFGQYGRTRDLFVLLFFLRGLPFVDLVFMRRNCLVGNRLVYNRHKTGRQMSVTLEPQALSIIYRYMNSDPGALYLFPFLTTTGNGSEHHQYESVLRHFNNQLGQLSAKLGFDVRLTSYCARHTWATFANCCRYNTKLICEGMGHSSVLVTETYLKKEENSEVDAMNRGVIAYGLNGQSFFV